MFYSNPHSSYSRIDYFFVAKNESYRVLDCKIHNITLSDHVPVSLIWDLGRGYSQGSNYKVAFGGALFSDPP